MHGKARQVKYIISIHHVCTHNILSMGKAREVVSIHHLCIHNILSKYYNSCYRWHHSLGSTFQTALLMLENT